MFKMDSSSGFLLNSFRIEKEKTDTDINNGNMGAYYPPQNRTVYYSSNFSQSQPCAAGHYDTDTNITVKKQEKTILGQ